MLKHMIILDELSDVDFQGKLFRSKAIQFKLPEASTNNLIDVFLIAANSLITAGRSMQSQGSSLNVSRNLKGPGYDIELKFYLRKDRSLFSRLSDFLGGLRGS